MSDEWETLQEAQDTLDHAVKQYEEAEGLYRAVRQMTLRAEVMETKAVETLRGANFRLLLSVALCIGSAALAIISFWL